MLGLGSAQGPGSGPGWWLSWSVCQLSHSHTLGASLPGTQARGGARLLLIAKYKPSMDFAYKYSCLKACRSPAELEDNLASHSTPLRGMDGGGGRRGFGEREDGRERELGLVCKIRLF